VSVTVKFNSDVMKHRRPNRFVRSQRAGHGFTLIEVTVVITVLAVIGSIVSVLMSRVAVAYHDVTVQAELHVVASSALDRIVRECRNIDSNDDGGTLHPDIDSAGTETLAWESGRSIALSGIEVLLNADGTNTDVLVGEVSSFSFDYFDESNNSLLSGTSVPSGQLENIRRISINLTLTRLGRDEVLHTRVCLRSMMSGAG